jgi:hypothetical protein
MKKTIAVAALLAASFAAPVIPTQAASSYPAKCLVLPLLQSDCRAVISDNLNDAASATRTVATRSTSAARRAAGKVEWPVPLWTSCEPAPAGSGHLYDCD